ncbi:uncharacterized protein V6R79_003593 [Siganus canaliculatus]
MSHVAESFQFLPPSHWLDSSSCQSLSPVYGPPPYQPLYRDAVVSPPPACFPSAHGWTGCHSNPYQPPGDWTMASCQSWRRPVDQRRHCRGSPVSDLQRPAGDQQQAPAEASEESRKPRPH